MRWPLDESWRQAAIQMYEAGLGPWDPTERRPRPRGGRKWAAYQACWLAQFDPDKRSCDGRTDRAHLIAQQALKRIAPDYVSDWRVWVPACRLHHVNWDNYRFDVPRSALSPELEALAEDLGLGPALDRRFGPKEQVVSQSTIG